MLRIVGIDPGKSGALALTCGGIILDCIDVPLAQDNSQVQVDGLRLFKWIEKHQPLDFAIIENVQPMRGVGSASEGMKPGDSFRFGLLCGELRMAFKCYGIPIKLVTPGVWKRHFGLLKSGKEDSRQKALHLRPEARRWLPYKNRHNVAEAMLLALYGSETLGML